MIKVNQNSKSNINKVYAWAYNNKINSMVGTPFKDIKTALKYKEIYFKRGWIGGLRELDKPKELTIQEKKDLKDLSCFLNSINKIIKKRF